MKFAPYNDPVNNPENYLWGIFYCNKKDGRVIVPKRNRWMGFTLNFSNPISILIILTFIVLAIFLSRL